MSNYLNYPEESTNIVKSRKKLSMIILAAFYNGTAAVAMNSICLFGSGSDALEYSIMYLWILLPVTTFILSLIIGKNDYWGQKKWLIALGFGLMYMLAEYGTFSAANMITFQKINLPEFIMIPIGTMVSLIGMGIGTGIRHVHNQIKKR